MDPVEKMHKYMEVIMHRKTATYRNGVLDFSHGEGGNNHIHMRDRNGDELGYIWFDTHVGSGWPTKPNQILGFCGKSDGSCSGSFRDIAMELFPEKWSKSDCLFEFTVEMFNRFWDAVLDRVR